LGPGEKWICSRWGTVDYATIKDVEVVDARRHKFDDDPLAVPEQKLVTLLEKFHDFQYDRDDAQYPYDLKDIYVPRGHEFNNCCTFVEALLVKAWELSPHFQWNVMRHRQMMIMSNEDMFSPVTAAVESGMAVSVPNPDSKPGPWTVVQGWRHKWRGGHTFIIVDHDASTDKVLMLESNSAYKLNGVGLRGIGNLTDTKPNPPKPWNSEDGVWTWAKVRNTYLHRRQAQLRVKGLMWSSQTTTP
jgi:hypothetical protein